MRHCAMVATSTSHHTVTPGVRWDGRKTYRLRQTSDTLLDVRMPPRKGFLAIVVAIDYFLLQYNLDDGSRKIFHTCCRLAITNR